MSLFDCHAHLDEFDDLSPVLERAAEAGVEAVLGVGINTETSRKVLEIARGSENPRVLPAAGLYPDEVTAEGIEEILAFLDENRKELAAVGEIGLDYWIKPLRKKAPGREAIKALQQEAFRLQLGVAREYGLVPIVHSRGAWADCCRMVEESGVRPVLFHWYSGPVELLAGVVSAGHCFSATPAATSSPQHRAALAAVPLDRIVLETDCPVPRRVGEERVPTEPADVLYSLKAVSELKGVPEAEVAETTTQTASQLFKISPQSYHVAINKKPVAHNGF